MRPCPNRARAWWGHRLVAESTSAVRVEEADRAPVLWLPAADVRFDLLRDEGSTEADAAGRDALWSVAGAPDGRDVLRRVVDPARGREALRGMAAFDHDRARVEPVDGPGDDPRDVAVTRFPTWGDAADLVDMLDVRPAGEHRWGHRRPRRLAPPRRGGQPDAGPGAGGRRPPRTRAPPGLGPHCLRAHGRRPPAPRGRPRRGRAGCTFPTVAARVGQDGRTCASGTVLLDATAADAVRHAVAPPAVAGPYDRQPLDMGVTGRDIRVVDGAYTGDPDAPVGPPTLDAWVRFAQVPDDPYLHAGQLAQFTGHLSIGAALRPHAGIGQDQAHPTLSTAVNAIAISFHGEVRADRWMLYHHLSTFAGDGMTRAECRVHDEAGDLVASFTVDAMVRP